MIRTMLLLHYFREQQFIGQKILTVQLSSKRAFEVFVELLTLARLPIDFTGTHQFPVGSVNYNQILSMLHLVLDVQTCSKPLTNMAFADVTSVRIMQLVETVIPE